MAEFAATTNLPVDQKAMHAAESVGATEKVRMGWAKLREGRHNGEYVTPIADRVRVGADSMVYDAAKGGWVSAPGKWGGPGAPSTQPGVGNRNVRSPENPFEVRQSFADVVDGARKQQLRAYFQQQFAGATKQ